MSRIFPAPIIGQSAASGAQVIDGSVLIDGHLGGVYPGRVLNRTPSAAGNNKTWTLSYWFKKVDNGGAQEQMFVAGTGPAVRTQLYLNDHTLRAYHTESPEGTNSFILQSYLSPAPRYRDFGPGWYHMCWVSDLPNGTFKCYVNNVLDIDGSVNTSYITQVNLAHKHTIGNHSFSNYNNPFTGRLSQMYMIDGQALDPSYFGFIDPLTNTWRPKKYTGSFTQSAINDGTVWSNSTNSSLTHADGVTGMFDGSLSTRGGHPSGSNLNSYVTIIDGASITATTGIRIYWNGVGAGQRYIRINESTELDDGSAQLTPGWSSVSSFSGTINKLEVKTAGTGSWSFSAIEIDGTILIDGFNNTGVNSFYLPLDGNSPIGQDKSGNGNDWTPVNFGGSVALDNPNVSGARPILNTTQGGTQAGVGVFGSKENKNYAVTVASVDGGNRYHFDGVDRPNPTLIRGATYTFDQSDSSNATGGGHPLRFATAADAAGSSQYTDGVVTNGTPGQVGAYTKITVPHDAPDTLYYYCTNHGGMGSSTSQTTDETKADPYAWKCVLGLPLVGDKEDIHHLIKGSGSAKTVSQTGSSSDIANSTEQSNFYGSSAKFNGNVARLEISGGGGTDGDYDFGTGDFCMECWFYPTATVNTNNRLFCSRGDRNNYQLMIGSNKYLQFDISGTNYTSANNVVSLNEWQHFAATRQSGTLRLFVNGNIVKEQASVTADLDETTGIDIGYESGYSSYINGYMQDIRVYKGTAKYTSNFVPASTNPDILPDTPSGVSGSSKLTKITDGAVSFDGTGDYLQFDGSAGSNPIDFGTGDFTVEAFVYHTGDADDTIISDSSGWTFTYGAGGDLRFYMASGSNIVDASTTFISNQWVHVAAVRESGTLTFFQNGIAVGSSSYSHDISANGSSTTIGKYHGGTSQNWKGSISNLRVVQGTALYTANFTPPTAPLTNITNTKLLCCQKPTTAPIGFTTITATGALPILNTNDDGTSVTSGNRSDAYSSNLVLALPLYNNTNDIHADIKGSGSNKTITSNGNVTSSSASSKFYGGSYIFDGNGDYLTVSGTLFGNGPWTYECWLNMDSGNESFAKVGSDTGATFRINNTSFQTDGDGVARLLYTNQNFGITAGEWFHFALVNDGSNAPIPYVNGKAARGSADRGTNSNSVPAETLRIGDGRPAGGALTEYDGYMQDVRFYNVAKYTSNFTPVGTFTRNQSAVSPGTIDANGDAVATNFNPFITDIHAVRGQETGYATLNPLDSNYGSNLKDGNLRAVGSSSWSAGNGRGTIAITSGKWFWEGTSAASGNTAQFGFANSSASLTESYGSAPANSWTMVFGNGTEIITPAANGSGYFGGSAISAGDVIGVALDMDNGTWQFFKNGVGGDVKTLVDTDSGSTASITELYPWVGVYAATIDVNFGQKPFKFPPPDGFQPLNNANIRPETVISRPDQYVGVKLFSMPNGGSGGTVTLDNDFDMVWTKNRSNNSTNHVLQDSVRGYGDNKNLHPNLTVQQTSTQNITAVNGRTLTIGSNSNYFDNNVAWSWKAGGNKNTFNVDDVGYANASDVNMNVGGIRAASTVSSGNDYSAGYAGHSPVGTWVDSDSWSGLPAYSSGQKGYFSGTETLSNGSVISAAANPKPFSAVANGSQGFVLRASTTVTLRLLVQSNVTEIATTSSDSQTFGNRTIVATNPTSGTYVEATGKCFWWSGNSNYPSISIMGTLYDAPAQPSIAPTGASVGTKQGFSIIKFSTDSGASGGDTIAHGLNSKPNMYMYKPTSTTGEWVVVHSHDYDQFAYLNATTQFRSISSQGGGTPADPTNSVLSLYDLGVTLASKTYICYAWHDVPGLQKFGVYAGNGASDGGGSGGHDGPFIELGFRPALIWIKNITTAADWMIHDTKRSPYNTAYQSLKINESEDENETTTLHEIDILSNGFKIRNGDAQFNQVNKEYVYCAWAEAPTVNLYGAQANSR